ncbi:MAG: Histidine kinase [Verrucomicrobiales bacterium]|nr:Histidine kinase [Verrucomicrobiales bacterium]
MEAVNSRSLKLSGLRVHLALALLLLTSATLLAQRVSNWRIYRASDGLQESICVGVSVSARGGLWVHHPDRSRVSWLDGYDVRKVAFPGLASSHIYEGRVGQIWAPYAGGVQEFKDGNWVRYPIEGLARKGETVLLPLRQGQVVVLSSERLVSFTTEPSAEALTIRQSSATALGHFTDIVGSHDGGAWIAAEHGIGKFASVRPLDAATPLAEHLTPEALGVTNVTALAEDDDGGITVIAHTRDGKKLPLYFDQQRWTTLPISVPDAIQAWRSPDGTFWELSPNALVHLRKVDSKWHSDDEAIAAHYYEAASDANGAFWVATSEGLYRYAPMIWQPGAGLESSGSMTIAAGNDQRLWGINSTTLYGFEGAASSSFLLPAVLQNAATPPEIIQELAGKKLLVGGGDHLFTFDTSTGSFSALVHPAQRKIKFVGAMKDGAACIQVSAADNEVHLELFDGQQFKPVLTLSTNVVGSEIQFAFVAQNGSVWLSGDKDVAYLADGKWQKTDLGGTSSGPLVAMLDVAPNKLWAAVHDRIAQFNGKDWTVVRSGFDRVNGMIKGRDGSIWVASNNGVHRFYKGDWVANGFEEGINSLAVQQVVEDSLGHIWAATARGLNMFHPEADNDPPQATIQPVSAESVPFEGNLSIEFGARDRWKQTLPDRLLFSYRIDEQDWSAYQSERAVHFNELGGGKHFFQVRAMDRNWNVDSKPALLEFVVPVPWFRETRLVLIGGAAGLAVLFFAGIAFNRHRQLVRSYAQVEKIVDQRTRELEKANRELFQSQKMNALGTLAAGIAHDFNSILSIIKGSAQIIETNVDNTEKIRTRVARINTAVDQGAGIVKAMLGFSRSSDHKVAQCALNPLIQDTIRLLGDRFQREAEVEFEPAENLPLVCVVPDFMQQIILNFILNAAESMSGAGKIIVRTGTLRVLPVELALTPEPAAAYAFVEVQDFGSGISPEIMPRIFEPFFTTKSLSTKRGTGLGLSMVYELAKEMKCGLSVRSNIGEGSAFTLIVPIAV